MLTPVEEMLGRGRDAICSHPCLGGSALEWEEIEDRIYGVASDMGVSIVTEGGPLGPRPAWDQYDFDDVVVHIDYTVDEQAIGLVSRTTPAGAP